MRRGALAVLLLWSGGAWAGGGAASDAYDEIREGAALDVHGLADLYLVHNFDNPASGVNRLRAFDFHADQAALGYLRVTLAHRPRRVGFRLDVGAGDTADVYRAEDPAVAPHPELARVTSYVEQAFVTVLVPLGREIQVDAGRFSTPVGLEDNESLPNWNYSRSLLFTWAEPSLHTGVRLTCKVVAELALSLFWVNGWNSVFLDGNGMRALAGAATWKPRDELELVLVYMGGLERPPTNLSGPLSFRNLVDAYVLWRVSSRLATAATVDYGNDRGADWWGVSGYARAQVTRWLALALRGEYFADPKGFTTGTAQRLAELTATVELRGEVRRLRLLLRLEWRHDQSSALVFDGQRQGTERQQDTLTVALLAAF
jgi:Putative beta-barrel porin-2, OmpL-like. bbp2